MKSDTGKNTKAFTLIEVLMSLVILAILMAAVAVAFDASVTNYQANEGIYRTINAGRQTLLRITNDVRTAQAVKPLGLPSGDPPTKLSLVTADGITIAYRFNSADNTLYLDNITDGTSFVLCRNIQMITFSRTVVPGSNPVAIRDVRIKMDITDNSGDIRQTLAAAAVVRRNL
jgi:prepilin-type N-terminal cleavage/methylation domain-containing protein